MAVVALQSLADLSKFTTKPTDISIVKAEASWCSPCHAIAPVFEKLAKEYSGRVQFLKVDVDAVPEVAQFLGVTAMPTFFVFKGTKKIDEMKGANPAGLASLVKKHAPAAGGSGSSAAVEKGLEGFSNLNDMIDSQRVVCLNEADNHTIRDLLKGGGDKWLESDADEQLLLHIPTNGGIKVRALKFTTVPSASAQAPKTVRLFVNSTSTLGFDDAESLEPAQELVLTEAQAKGEESVQLRFVRFQNVTSLSIFIAGNQGGEDVTRLDKLEIWGQSIDGTDMSALSKGEHDHEH